jgi:hypothetical protein
VRPLVAAAAAAEAAERRRRSAEAAVSAVAAQPWVAERALALPRPQRQTPELQWAGRALAAAPSQLAHVTPAAATGKAETGKVETGKAAAIAIVAADSGQVWL